MSEFAQRRYVVTGAASGNRTRGGRALARGRGGGLLLRPQRPDSCGHPAHRSRLVESSRSIDAAVEQLDGEFDGLMNVAGVPGTVTPDVVLAVNTLAVRQLSESMFDRLKPGGHGDDCVVDGGLWLARAT